MKKKTTMTVTDIRFLAEGICSMTLRYPEGEAPEEVKPGQFAGLYPNDADKLLPRPISICRWDPEKKELRFVFRVAGAGRNCALCFGSPAPGRRHWPRRRRVTR